MFSNTASESSPPLPGAAFFGQDAQHDGLLPAYVDNGDGTVTDQVTGLMWTKTPDLDGDGAIEEEDKPYYEELAATAAAATIGGYTDWRVPTIKELYSLINFMGTDPSGMPEDDTSLFTPFIDTDYFDFAYGDSDAGVRVIDAQYWSSTDYVSPVGEPKTFGVNFADGRIKGYGLRGIGGTGKSMFLLLVRGNPGYGINDFEDNGDGTVTDHATGLMWAQQDSGGVMDWEAALDWASARNTEAYLGHDDWRLPNAKELQSLIDYTRSPDAGGTAAIDPLFSCTPILNEAGQDDFGCYWSSTTHISARPGHSGDSAAYVAFGRAMGYMNNWVDVHGAGAQRSDPKVGDPDDFPFGRGPQGDAIRILNFVRLVRDAR